MKQPREVEVQPAVVDLTEASQLEQLQVIGGTVFQIHEKVNGEDLTDLVTPHLAGKVGERVIGGKMDA